MIALMIAFFKIRNPVSEMYKIRKIKNEKF